MSLINKGVHAVFVHTQDLKRSAEWYSNLLGLPFEEEWVTPPVYNLPVQEGIHLTIDDHSFDPSYRFEPTQTPVFNFYSPKITEAYHSIQQQGIPIKRKVEWDNSFAWFWIEDPDGNAVMICGSD